MCTCVMVEWALDLSLDEGTVSVIQFKKIFCVSYILIFIPSFRLRVVGSLSPWNMNLKFLLQ